VGIPGERPLGGVIDVAVVDHGYRSVTGVPHPLDLNAATMDELTAIPGLGRQRAGSLLVDRPYVSVAEAETTVDVDLRAYATAEASDADAGTGD
jgi:radical SAM superfamily enzyme with C-terminal helix-hairpin-helix motif